VLLLLPLLLLPLLLFAWCQMISFQIASRSRELGRRSGELQRVRPPLSRMTANS
jgi:hypothetical protein